MSLSSVVLTKNSEKTLEKCLRSLTWCDEIIVIDDSLSDKTISLAERYNAKVFKHSLQNDFSAQRNFGLEKASKEWILFVDSDEMVPIPLRNEIISIANNQSSTVKGYFVRRIDTMWGKKLLHGETGNIWLLRLGERNAGEWEGRVHERWEIKSNTERLENPLEHFPHPTVSEFLTKINLYSSIRAEELHRKKITVSFFDIILYPKAKFILNYFVRVGFLDGIPGFLVAVCMSFHSFLVRGKLWQLQNTHK